MNLNAYWILNNRVYSSTSRQVMVIEEIKTLDNGGKKNDTRKLNQLNIIYQNRIKREKIPPSV